MGCLLNRPKHIPYQHGLPTRAFRSQQGGYQYAPRGNRPAVERPHHPLQPLNMENYPSPNQMVAYGARQPAAHNNDMNPTVQRGRQRGIARGLRGHDNRSVESESDPDSDATIPYGPLDGPERLDELAQVE